MILLRRNGNHIVQRGLCLREEALQIARGLANTMFILHQGDAHIALAILAETDAGGDGYVGLLQQQLGELQRSERLEFVGDRCPGEHGGGRRRDMPSGTSHRIHQAVPPLLIGPPDVFDAILGTVQGGRGRDLYRRESAIVQIGFDPRQSGDQALVAHRKTDAPAWHGIGLR